MVAKRHEILFIDANVVDKQTLIADVAPNVKIIELNDKTNAISQIVTALKNQKNLDAIHIISQGSSGELEFANGTLNNDNLSHYTSQLQKIGSSLSKNGDILLYGCDVAKGTEGSAFVKAFAKVTSADVAASIDTTGAASLGGDWKLEKLNGVIASKTFASTDYAYTLANKTIAQTFPEGTGSALAYKTNYDGMSGLSALTVEMWIKTSDTNGSLLSWAASGMGNDFLLAMTSQSNFAIWVGNKHYDVANTLNISDNNWHHLAATWSTAGTVKLYVDGTAYTATLGFTTATPPVQYEAYTSPLTDSSAITTDRLLLGNDQDMVSGVISALNSTQTFSGSMDAVAIWNSAKTFTPSTYKTAIAGNETGLINYWSMDESTGNLVDSKNAANLTTDRATNQLTTETFDITSAVAIDVNENVATSATVYTIVSNAGSGRYASVDYSISGTDSALFNVAASTGIITFKSSTNYELPLDSGANRIYDLSVTATGKDHLGATIDVASQNLAITLKDVNEAPTVVTLSNATTTLAENTDSTTRIKVADIAVTDDALGTNALSLTGAEASYFEISGNVLYLKAATVLDYENKTSYAVTVNALDSMLAGSIAVATNYSLAITNVNEAPVITSDDTGTVAENAATSTVIYTTVATDVDSNDTRTYSLKAATGDVGLLAINATTGAVTLKNSADFETKASYTFTVIATDAGSLSAEKAVTVSVTNVNEAPVITSNGTGTVAENSAPSTVIYTALASDVDVSDTRTYSLKASTGDVGLLAINAATGEVTLKNSADFETKASYTFTVIATDTGGLSAEKAVTVSVTNVNDLPTGNVTISGIAKQGEILTAAHSLADADGLGTVAYQWKANGTAISGATASTYTLTQADVGKTFTVTASYIDGLGTAESVASNATAAILNVNDLPTGNVTISGTAKQGEILTAAHSLADADGLGTVGYQWKANDTVISGATASTYTLTQADVGKTLTVTASYIDGLGTAESVISNATTTIANLNDLPTGSVTISGTAKQGEILTAANSLADADGLGTVGYQWKANGTAISGATASTYTLTQAEVGKTLTVTASYIDGLGTKESITSTKTLTVENNLPFGGFNEKTSLLTIGDFNASIENMTADVGASGKLSGKIALTGYDAIRTDEKPLNLMAKVTYDATKKISLTAALDSNTPWEKPFGLTGTKINDLSLAMVGTYSPFAFKKVDFTSTLERDGTNTGIAKLLKIESVAVKISIDVETKKTTLNGTLSGDIPLLPTVGELGVDLKEAKLKVEKTGENYATDISGKIVLKGYDPTRTDEPNLLLNGGVSVKEKTLSLSASLDSNTPWENPFGLMGSKITVLSLIAESTIDSSAFQKVDFDATLAWNEKGKGATGISEFMYDELGIRSLVVAIKVDSGAKDSKTKESTTDNFSGETISLSGVATVKKQLVSVGDFKVTLTKEKLELAKNDSVSFAILSSQIVLAGYDPSQKNEPDLFLNGSLAVSSEKEIALNVALDETTPWINPFGLSGTKMSVLSLDVVGKLSPAALTVGFDATVEWNSTKINPAIGASKFLNDLGVKSLSVHVGLDTEKQSMSIKGTIDMQIQVFKVEVKPNDYFSLTLTQSSVEMMLTLSTPNLSLSLLGRMELKGYDFSQRYEPTLTVTGAVQLDLTSIALGVSFSTGAKPWMNPFGLKGFEITTLAVQIGATYIPPYLDSFGFVADVGFYNTSFAAGFYIKLSNPTVAFYIETKPDKPLNLANLIDGSLSSFKELNGVRESVNKLFSKSNITIESIDGDNNGDLDPLILFSPTGDVKVVDQVIPGGMGINGKVTFGDFSAILALNTDKNFSKTTTGLVLSVDKSVNFKALMVDDSPWIMLLEQFEFSQKPLEQLQQVIKLFTNLIGGDVAKISPISDTKGNILPLVKFIPNASGLQVGKTQYDAGFSFNVQLDVLGEYSLIKFNANAKFTKLSGSLEISTIHIGKILSLSGIKDSDPLTLVVKFFAKDFLLSGNGKLELFGVTIASAKFTINTKSIEIQNVNINLGVIALSNADLSATIGSVNVTGSSKIKLLGMTIADSDFSMSNHKFSINKGTFSLFGATFNIAGSSLNMDSDILTGTIKITLGDFGVLNAKIIATPKTVTFGTSVSFKIPLVATVKFGLLISTNGDVVIAVDSKIFGHKYSFDASTNLKDITISKLTALIWDAIDGKDTDKPEKWTGNATSEEYSGGGSADKLSGEGGNDSIRGNGGNDVIEAGKGNDVIIGGKGNDTLNGNEGNDSIEGNSGKDMLDGGSGVDTLEGGDGDDTYTVDNEKDIVKEDKSSGDDTVETMLLSYSLSANVEDLIFTEISNHNGTGNVLNNQITGNNGNDSLKGMAGNDKLNGEKGDDVIYGGDGDDKLNGGAGADTLEGGDDKDTLDGGDGQDLMIGGKGADVFVVRLENSNDVIQDFSNAQSDKIDLSTIDANILKAKNQAFTFIEGEAFSAAGQIRFETTTSTLYGNVNADLAADFSIKISGVSTLITANFIL